MRLSRFFITRPIFAAVIAVVITIIGAIAYLGLPISQYPDIVPPTVTVSASYPGASAETVAETVAAPIEQEINGVDDMLYQSSQSTGDGNVTITVTFKSGTDLDAAQVLVQNRVAVATPRLPQEVQRLGVVTRKTTPDFLMVVNLISPDNSVDRSYISNYALTQVKDRLARINGVGDVRMFGARDYAMRIWIDPGRAAALDLTAGDIVQALRSQNIQVAAGTLGQPGSTPAGNAFQLNVETQGRLKDAGEFSQVVIRTDADGRQVRVSDVARVELGAADYSSNTYLSNQPTVILGVFQRPGSNALAAATAVEDELKAMSKNFPKGLEYRVIYNPTEFISQSIDAVYHTLGEAILLVVLVVIVFLQNWRAAIIPVVAIPVSLIGTMAVLLPLGYSLNNLSLFGLVLAIGIVVDDAIVVVENVERWIEQGYAPRDAAYKAMDEVTAAVIAIALGLSAVFIPVAFISGISGQFYRQFALTIAVSTLLSALNSLTLSPALAALMLKPRHGKQDWFARTLNFLFGWFFRLFNRGLDRFTEGYATLLRRVVRFGVVALLLYGGLLLLTYQAFRTVPTGFIPTQDKGYLVANLQLPDASSTERTDAVIRRMAQVALRTPGVKDTFAIAGYSFLSQTNQSNAAAMFVVLEPFEQRVGDPQKSSDAIAGKLMGEYAQIQEGFALVFPPPPVQGMGFAGGFKMQVQDRAGRGTPQELQAVTEQLIAAAAQTPYVNPQATMTTFRASVPQLYVDVDREKAKTQGVSVTDVFESLQVYLGSLYVNDFNFLGRTYQVVAQAEPRFRARAEDIRQLKTRNAAGEMVPLGSLMDIQDTTGPARINRYNLFRSAEINGQAQPGISSGQVTAEMERLARDTLPPGYGFEWTELTYQEKLSGNTALWIFPLCVLFVWLTHSAEYESFALSTAIILIVPMCLLSGIFGVWLRGMDNNIFTQIGFVVLAGLSAKNAVLIVEFAKQQQEHGKGRFEAAVEAARLRLRPILMTSFAFILGVVPLVIATGAGAEMRQAIGTTVFFGMLGVTFFGIFLTPVFYVAIQWVVERGWRDRGGGATPAGHGRTIAAPVPVAAGNGHGNGNGGGEADGSRGDGSRGDGSRGDGSP